MDHPAAGLARVLGAAIVDASARSLPLLVQRVVEHPAVLFGWESLNDVLRADELDWVHPHAEGGGLRYRLALFREGGAVDPASFFRRARSPRGTSTSFVDPSLLEAQLHKGGTFVVRDLDREDAGVRAFAEELEVLFRAPVMGGVFASWGDATGLDLHWDPMDNVVVQVAGTRSWTLWAPSAPRPVAGMKLDPPSGPGDWHGTLHAGDALFVPRGWWHRPVGTGGPAMHLTFGIYRPTGLDLVRWLCDRAHIDGDTITFDRNLAVPWTAEILDEYLESAPGRGLRNRAEFRFPELGASGHSDGPR